MEPGPDGKFFHRPGYVLATPLQMAMIAATVANGGTSFQPSLIYQIQEPDGTSVRRPDKFEGT
jgi:cell division protein FtsI/penicillin-binding protein 2